ncbi:zinc finger protein 271-like [Mya arenaria]|uniref:zinc finger protein 271-like n=1 Tax=Mya arenaria TaxID=6604 RepID=UPI0022E0BA28|nr:zinc finger protein 271-like [Mya arenaria]
MDQELVYPNVAGEEEVVFSSQEAALSDGRIQAAELMISMAASGHSDVSITSEALHEEGVDVSHSGDIPMIVSMPSEQHSELGNKDPGRIRQRARIEVMEYNDVGDKQELPEDLVIITGKSEQDNVSSYPSGHILSQGFSGDIGNTITLRQMLTGLGSEKEVVKQHSEMETSVQNLIHSTYEQVVEEDGGSNTVVIEMPYGGGDNVIVSAQSENVPMNGTIATDVCVGNNYVKDGEVITVSGDQALDATGEMINVSLQGSAREQSLTAINKKRLEEMPTNVLVIEPRKQGHMCIICKAFFVKITELYKHRITHNENLGVSMFKCSTCQVSFSEPLDLEKHKQLHIDRRVFKCCICSDTFSGFNNYKCHLRIHDKLATYTCDMCPFLVFQLRKHFISHLDDHEIAKEHYIPGQALRLICFVCNKEFCDRGQLRRHQQYYHSDKSYKCSVCGKAFCERAKLQRHMLIHNGRRDFTCSACNKAFSLKHNLVAHMNVHTKEKPFYCYICRRTFSQKVCLQRHLRVHEGFKIEYEQR